MDNQNTEKSISDNGISVLILVLMDNQKRNHLFEMDGRYFVLILVLMDNQNTRLLELLSKPQDCLNPCSNG